MSQKSFSVSEIYSQAWNTFNTHLSELVIAFIISIVLTILSSIDRVGDNLITSLIAFIFSIIGFLASLGYIQVLLKISKNKKVEFKDYFYTKSGIASFLVVSLLLIPLGFLIVAAVVLPFIASYSVFTNISNPNPTIPAALLFVSLLLIFASVYLSIRLSMISYLIIDKNLGPIEAIKGSWEITKGEVLQLFIFTLSMVGVNILGLIALGFGLLVTIPVTTLAQVHIYNILQKKLDLDLDEEDEPEIEIEEKPVLRKKITKEKTKEE